ncbi:uncharacterized protein LOC125809965 [Solanum verrucosum]|uniref:uncharacterized protein LOC125809965 n=1 Tax=Solanum verrucosum TaxID=315347 RepID=UPI0020D0FF74|nr:uncharacterized protein LOC125809965 [Solanum verrucosum]
MKVHRRGTRSSRLASSIPNIVRAPVYHTQINGTKQRSKSLGEFHITFTMSHQCYEINSFEDFFGSQIVFNHNTSRLSSVKVIPLPQVMFKISTLPYGHRPRL